MGIIEADIKKAEILSKIISEANEKVAKQFNINFNNNPKHPSFYNKESVISDFNRGEKYFLFQKNDFFIGCVAFRQSKPDTAYLNRLAVLPNYQNQGVGKTLVDFIINYSSKLNIRYVSIGIIAEHETLKSWYEKIGFKEVKTTKIDHLPFDVTYMKYTL